MNEQPLELWAFLENSDFVRRKRGVLYRHDEVKLIRHDEFLETDYQLLRSINIAGIRDAARWYVTHPAPHRFDWSWMDRMMEAAHRYELRMYLDLWHYGYPDWLDLMADDAPMHFAEFARAIAERYPALEYYCICNEPSLLVEWAGQRGRWSPFLRRADPVDLRRQVCRAIILASRAVLDVRPNAQLVLPDPWHAYENGTEDQQAAVFDTVMGRRDPELGGASELVTVVGLNHYRDSTLPPFHKLILNARARWADKPLWVTETSGPVWGWRQREWFWWMLAEIRLANLYGANIPVFTWAPVLSMYHWTEETRHLKNGIWRIEADGTRVPNDKMLEAIALAREYGYLV